MSVSFRSHRSGSAAYAGLALFVVVMAAHAAVAQSIEGTATYRERIALPPTAVFEATLEDVSRADAPAEVIARTRVTSPGNPPIRFAIAYDPERIDERGTYVVRARIVDGTRLMFITDASYAVLTRGHGNSVSLLMRMIRRS